MIRAPWPFFITLTPIFSVTPFDAYTTLLLRMYGTTGCGFDWRLFYRLMHLSSSELNFICQNTSVFSFGGEFYLLHF